MINWDDSRLIGAVRRELGIAVQVQAEPVLRHVVRWPKAIPQYEVGHTERVERIERRAAVYPGLFVTGNSYHGVALNDCSEQALAVARRVAQFLAK